MVVLRGTSGGIGDTSCKYVLVLSVDVVLFGFFCLLLLVFVRGFWVGFVLGVGVGGW